jgi:hypothetical protein
MHCTENSEAQFIVPDWGMSSFFYLPVLNYEFSYCAVPYTVCLYGQEESEEIPSSNSRGVCPNLLFLFMYFSFLLSFGPTLVALITIYLKHKRESSI